MPCRPAGAGTKGLHAKILPPYIGWKADASPAAIRRRMSTSNSEYHSDDEDFSIQCFEASSLHFNNSCPQIERLVNINYHYLVGSYERLFLME